MNKINNEHSALVAKLAKSGDSILEDINGGNMNLVHMALGIAGESGELVDAIKKHVIYNKPIDMENIVEELGDLEFYMEGIRQELGISREETLESNIAKLNIRYSNGYSDKSAQERADKKLENE